MRRALETLRGPDRRARRRRRLGCDVHRRRARRARVPPRRTRERRELRSGARRGDARARLRAGGFPVPFGRFGRFGRSGRERAVQFRARRARPLRLDRVRLRPGRGGLGRRASARGEDSRFGNRQRQPRDGRRALRVGRRRERRGHRHGVPRVFLRRRRRRRRRARRRDRHAPRIRRFGMRGRRGRLRERSARRRRVRRRSGNASVSFQFLRRRVFSPRGERQGRGVERGRRRVVDRRRLACERM